MSRQTFLYSYFFLFKTNFEQTQYKKVKSKEIKIKKMKSIDKHKKKEVIHTEIKRTKKESVLIVL